MAVDKVLAKTVHQEAERSRQETAEALDKIPLSDIIAYLRSKGYRIKPPKEPSPNWLGLSDHDL